MEFAPLRACTMLELPALLLSLWAGRFRRRCLLHLSELSLSAPVRNPAAAAWCSVTTMRSSGRGRPATSTLVGDCCSLQLLARSIVLHCAHPC